MMGSRYPEGERFSFYDPEQDWEGQRVGLPRHRSAPVSPRGPISPRAPPPGIYPPELDHGYYNRSGGPSSPHERPFGPYDREQDLQERRRQGMGAPFRPSEVEPGYYSPHPQSSIELDSHSRGARRGSASSPLYVNPNSNHLSIPQGTPPNGRYGIGTSPNDNYGQGTPPNDSYRQGVPPNDNYARGAPVNDSYGRGAPLSSSYGQRIPPNDSYIQGIPMNDRYGRGAPLSDNYGRGAPPSDNYGRGAPPSDGYGRGTPPTDNYGRGAPPSDNYGRGVPPNDPYERGSLESSYAGRGVSGRTPSGTSGNNYGAPASGTRLPYGEESSGYRRGLQGRGAGVVPLGDGRYEYGGLHQPERLDVAEDYSGGSSTPAPISSEYAHQVYASVFSDPVYGGARQLNSRAGYLEEPNSVQRVHHREDVLRHPDDF